MEEVLVDLKLFVNHASMKSKNVGISKPGFNEQ